MKIKELRKEISEEGLDAFLTRKSARYFAETKTATIVIITNDKATVICERMNLDRTEKESVIDDIRPYSKAEVPFRKEKNIAVGEPGEIIGQVLEEYNVKNIGHDGLDSEFLEGLKEKYDADYQNISDIVWNLRKVKTEKEIDHIRKAAEIAEKGMKKAERIIEPGISELEIAAEIEYEMRKAGSEGTPFDTIVAAGENSIYPHTEPSEKKIEKEELVVIDLGARWKGYDSDLTRTFSVSPTKKQKNILQIAKKAQKKAKEKVRGGVKASEIDKSARKVFRSEGFEEDFLHGTGHGVGLNIHEPPTLSSASDDVLDEGMIITIEPGIYVEGVGGSRFEDMVLVKKDGYEKITSS